MRTFTRIWPALVVCFLSLGQVAYPQSSSCPARIESQLCNQLKVLSDTDWVSCLVELWSPPVDSQITDPNKNPPASKDSIVVPASIKKESDSLFGKYDLRWPEDLKNRAVVPTPAEGRYRVFATKKTILSIGSENYIQMVYRWAPDPPSITVYLAPKGVRWVPTQFYNLKGQQLTNQESKSNLLFFNHGTHYYPSH